MREVLGGRARLGIALAALAAAGAANADEIAKIAADPATARLGDGLYTGAPIQAECATVWPVYTEAAIADVGDDFVSLADAQAAGAASIRETGAQGAAGGEGSGTVNTLVVENTGDKPILVLAGTLLKGGKQDRQVGQDFIVPARQIVAADAFCVEHGRWTASRDGADTGGSFEAKRSLATKAVRKKAQYEGDQSGVWEEVAKENARAGKAPGSGTLLATVEDADVKAAERRQGVERRIRDALAAAKAGGRRPVGLAYAVAGKVREVRVFTHPRIFDRFAETLVATIALEELQGFRGSRGGTGACRPADVKKVVALVQGASSADAKAKAQKQRSKAGSYNEKVELDDVMSSECLPTAESKKGVTKSFMYAE
jgi:hypothetical protein